MRVPQTNRNTSVYIIEFFTLTFQVCKFHAKPLCLYVIDLVFGSEIAWAQTIGATMIGGWSIQPMSLPTTSTHDNKRKACSGWSIPPVFQPAKPPTEPASQTTTPASQTTIKPPPLASFRSIVAPTQVVALKEPPYPPGTWQHNIRTATSFFRTPMNERGVRSRVRHMTLFTGLFGEADVFQAPSTVTYLDVFTFRFSFGHESCVCLLSDYFGHHYLRTRHYLY
jgi:hypothetical protein